MSDFSQQQPYTVTWNDDIPSLTTTTLSALTTIDISSLISNDTITFRDHASNYTAGHNYGSFGSTMAGNSYSTNSGLTYVNTISPLTTNSISAISSIDISTLLNTSWSLNRVEWVDMWPDFNKIKNMRDKYPALDKAMGKVVSIYNMVKDDYDNPVPKK